MKPGLPRPRVSRSHSTCSLLTPSFSTGTFAVRERRASSCRCQAQHATDAARGAAHTVTRRGLRERDLPRGGFGGGAGGENARGERRGVRRVEGEGFPPIVDVSLQPQSARANAKLVGYMHTRPHPVRGLALGLDRVTLAGNGVAPARSSGRGFAHTVCWRQGGMRRVSLTSALDSVSACIGRPTHNSSPCTYNPGSPRWYAAYVLDVHVHLRTPAARILAAHDCANSFAAGASGLLPRRRALDGHICGSPHSRRSRLHAAGPGAVPVAVPILYFAPQSRLHAEFSAVPRKARARVQ
ncbi:hypothetical protein DFH09DRAFT_1159943 [Mycena vulgaris]|nr:hypothetical protein DFH09DRAFT_1159943 [Mycena vulgaris]